MKSKKKKIFLLLNLTPREKHFAGITLLIFITAVVYFNSLYNQFLFDDNVVVYGNAFITSLKNIPQFFSDTYFLRSKEASYRPVVTFSYMIDYYLFKFKASGFHFMNIIWHMCNAIFVYWLMNLILKKRTLALLCALFFVCHPVQTEAVNCIGLREELLCAFFYLLSFICYIRKKIILGSIFFLLSLFSKEMGLTLPILIFFYFFLFEKNKIPGGKISFSWRSSFGLSESNEFPPPDKEQLIHQSEILKSFFAYATALIFYCYIRFFVMVSPKTFDVSRMGGSLYTSLLTTMNIVTKYILLLLFPFELSLKYVTVPAQSIFEKDVLLSFSLIITILAVAIHNLQKNKKISFGLIWFFVTLIPVYNIIPIFNPIAERYLYLPAIGFCIVFALIWQFILQSKNVVFRRSAYIILLIVLGNYSTMTIIRNFDWKDKESLWTKTMLTTPDHWGSHNGMGIIYLERQEYDLALREFMTALKLKKELKVYYNIGVVYWEKGELDEALKWWQLVLQKNPIHIKAANGIGCVFSKKGMSEAAADIFRQTILLEPFDYKSYFLLSDVYYKMDRYEQAIICLKKVAELCPVFIDALYNLGFIYSKNGKHPEALYWYDRALKINPDDAGLLYAVGRVYMSTGRFKEAASVFKKALQTNTEVADLHYYLGLTLKELGWKEEAEKEIEKALEIDPDFEPEKETREKSMKIEGET